MRLSRRNVKQSEETLLVNHRCHFLVQRVDLGSVLRPENTKLRGAILGELSGLTMGDAFVFGGPPQNQNDEPAFVFPPPAGAAAAAQAQNDDEGYDTDKEDDVRDYNDFIRLQREWGAEDFENLEVQYKPPSPIQNGRPGNWWEPEGTVRNDLDDMMRERAKGSRYQQVWDEQLDLRRKMREEFQTLTHIAADQSEWDARVLVAQYPNALQTHGVKDTTIPPEYRDLTRVRALGAQRAAHREIARRAIQEQMKALKESFRANEVKLHGLRHQDRRNGVA